MKEFLKSRLFQYLIIAIVLAGAGVFFLVPEGIFTTSYWREVDGVDPSAILRNLGLLAIGVIALPLAIWRSVLAHQQTIISNQQATNALEQTKIANRQAETAVRGQNTDRFQKAAEMLGSAELSVREAGIFALKELAEADSRGHYLPVQKTLCSFLRNRSKLQYEAHDKNVEKLWKPKENEPGLLGPLRGNLNFTTPCSSDMIETLRAMSDLRTDKTTKIEMSSKWHPDLRQVNFFRFPGHSNFINLSKANLEKANLTMAYLNGADLKGAILFEADLTAARLKEANLTEANLIFANLNWVRLSEANLTLATLHGANLQGAGLFEANLTMANLRSADLQGANLTSADFTRAHLTNAKFSLPILPETDWPAGWKPTDHKEDGCYTFYRPSDYHVKPPTDP